MVTVQTGKAIVFKIEGKDKNLCALQRAGSKDLKKRLEKEFFGLLNERWALIDGKEGLLTQINKKYNTDSRLTTIEKSQNDILDWFLSLLKIEDDSLDISLCASCGCMTKTIKGHCGKCKEEK